jgi:hypothetical protein
MSNAESLYFDGISGSVSASSLLEKHGPHIDVWPSGYKTISFGEGKMEPDAANAIAAVGALVVRANGGDEGARSSLSSAISNGTVGVTLQSSTMDTVLKNLKNGATGAHQSMAIVTNIVDRGASISLGDGVLLGQSQLASALGESVRDAASRTLTSDRLSQGAARSGNELAIVEGSAVENQSEQALSAFLRKYYGKAPPSEERYRLIYAYTALARRAAHRIQSGSHYGAKAWLGRLVDLSTSVDQSELPKICHEQLEKAERLHIDGSPRIGGVGHVGDLSLPNRERSAADAVKLGVEKGLPSYRPQQFAANGGDVDPLSYSGKEAQKLNENVYRRYIELIGPAMQQYLRCREEVASTREKLLNEITMIDTRLREGRTVIVGEGDDAQEVHFEGVYTQRPHLAPERRREALTQNMVFTDYVHGNTPITAGQSSQLSYNPDRNDLRGWRGRLAVQVAALSAQRNNPGFDMEAYRRLMANPNVREAVSTHLKEHRNLGLLEEFDLTHIPETVLEQLGIKPHKIIKYKEAHKNLPDDDIEPYAELAGPPLYLMQLVADVINYNADSILPEKKVLGRLKVPRGNDAALDRNWVEHLAERASTYVRHRYGLPSVPNRKLTGLLLECDLAERRGFNAMEDTSPEAIGMAQRIREASKSLTVVPGMPKPRNLPPQVQEMIAKSNQILGTQTS